MISKSTYVKSSGNPQTAKYIIVGEQPGRTEVIRGAPFVGPAGQELDQNLHLAGISRTDCYFTNVIKDIDRPLGYYIEETKSDYLIHPEGRDYLQRLESELSECSAKVIIVLGNIALYALCNRKGILKWRGSVLQPEMALEGKLVIPSIHPATIIPPKNVYKNKRLLIYDLRRARQVQEKGWHPHPRHYITRPSYFKCLNYLTTCEEYGLLGNLICYDIEVDVFNGEVLCISFSHEAGNGISIPFIAEGGDYFTIEQESELWKRIGRLLEDPRIQIGGQNLTFDCHYLLRKYGIHVTTIVDTMVAQKILLPDYPVGLHFICSLYTDIPYYKDDGKYWLKGIGTFEKGWIYNITDSDVCSFAHPKQVVDLMKQQNYYTYERKCKIILPLVYMMEHGIRINLGSMTQAYNEMGREIEQELKLLHQEVNFELNPNSPKQVGDYFYKTLGLKPYKGKTGNDTTDEKALKRIARRGFTAASRILKIRGLGKERSTFLNPIKVDPDRRMRCSYNPVGTRFSRISSSENIFGTGNNLQNQPHKVLTHFLPDPYYVFYGMDLSQAENRIVAYVGRIQQMIDAFERGEDIHGLTARIMINIFYGMEKGSKIDIRDKAPIGDGKKTWRDWGKKANHGLNYDLGYKTFSLYNEISETDGKTIVDIYHRAYPGVRGGFHAYVKQCINKNRTLTNLMGRHTLFTDRLDDNLYKDAYACIPQGTVGDIIDQRGMSFVYYNRDPRFIHVELLIQVHDQIGFQIPTPFHPTTSIDWATHEFVLTEIKRSLEQSVYTHYKLPFVIPVDTTMSITLNKDNKQSAKDLKSFDAKTLEQSYYEVTRGWLPI